ncbi:MAG: hypothetical protein ACK5S6_03830, partial [bacterium]
MTRITFIPTTKGLVSATKVQTFSTEEKAQACSNIAAASVNGTYANPAWITELASTKITGTLTKLQQHAQTAYKDTSNTFSEPLIVNNTVGIENASPLAKLHVGAGTYNPAGDVSILMSRNIVTSGSLFDAHGLTDAVIVNRSGGMGYASLDSRPSWTGSHNYDHALTLQSFPVYGSSGTMTNFHGMVHGLTVNTGTVTNSYGIELRDATGTGTVTTQYGVYIASLTKATTNWAIYTSGTTPSRLGGPVGIGRNPETTSLTVNNNVRISDATASVGKLDLVCDSGASTVRAGGTGADTLDVGGASQFTISTFSGGWQERVRVTNSGVGIGRAPEVSGLTVNGTQRLSDPGAVGKLDFEVSSSASTIRAGGTVSDTLDLGGATHLTLSTFSGGSWGERVRVTATGVSVTGSTKLGTKTIATLPSAASSSGERYQVSDSATIANRI